MTPSTASTEDLLRELLRRHDPQPGPNSMMFIEPVRVAVLGIGRDHSATLIVHEPDLKALMG